MRVASYLRVSSQEQTEGYSLDAQRRAIQQEAAAHDYSIVAEFSDEGRSAKHDSLDRRPGFRAAVESVAAGQADALIVHKLDRAARNLRVLLDVLQRIDGRLISVVERTDYTTPQGKFFVHMLGVLAQFYSDNLSQEVKKGKDERRRTGLYNGRLPFGFARNPDSANERGQMPPVADTEPVLCTLVDRRTWSRYDALLYLYTRAAEGTSCPQLVHELGEIGFPLGLGTVWEILNNRFYLGEVCIGTDAKRRHARQWLPGAHEPIISRDLFERAEQARIRNKSGAAAIRRNAQVYPLTGLGRCARCGGTMHCRHQGHRDRPAVFCANRSARRSCDQPSSVAAPIEEQCLEYVRRLEPPLELARWVAEQVRGEEKDTRRERQALTRRLKNLRDLYEWGDIAPDEYLARKVQLERDLAALTPQDAGASTERIVAYLRDLASLYEDATDEERNELLREVFAAVEIDAGTVTRAAFQPGIDRLLQAWRSDAFDSSGLTERVCIAEPCEDGFWLLPPLAIARHTTPRIPEKYWPQVLRAYESGMSPAVLAGAWNVHERTVWRVISRARGGV